MSMEKVLQRRITILEAANRKLVAGMLAMSQALKHYGTHTAECTLVHGGPACNCEWEATLKLMEEGERSSQHNGEHR